MEKFAQDLKERFVHLVEAIRSCRSAKGEEDGKETNLKSVEKLGVQSRAVKVTAAKGPTRPNVPKGAPPQTS